MRLQMFDGVLPKCRGGPNIARSVNPFEAPLSFALTQMRDARVISFPNFCEGMTSVMVEQIDGIRASAVAKLGGDLVQVTSRFNRAIPVSRRDGVRDPLAVQQSTPHRPCQRQLTANLLDGRTKFLTVSSGSGNQTNGCNKIGSRLDGLYRFDHIRAAKLRWQDVDHAQLGERERIKAADAPHDFIVPRLREKTVENAIEALIVDRWT